MIDIVPLSVIPPDKYDEYFTDEADRLFLQNYDEMLEKGVIIKKEEEHCFGSTSYEYSLILFEEKQIESIEKETEEIIKTGDVFEVNDYLNKLENEEHLNVKEEIHLNNNGYIGSEDRVIKDHIFGSVLYKETAIKSYKLVERFEKVKADLIAEISG